VSETHPLCAMVSGAPTGASVRNWTLRADNNAHHHGRVRLAESPLYLDLSWRPSATERVEHVGVFRLDLPGLLQGRFIRHDPAGSDGPEVRLRVVRTSDGRFYIQSRAAQPRVELPAPR
jgi:hypothetical protein